MPPSTESKAPADFDFMVGDWRVQHRRLNARLSGCNEWTEFAGTSSTRTILGGMGNVEDNVLCFPEGDVRAVAVRSFNQQTQTWAIWWIDGRAPHSLDAPLIGSFSGDVGLFFADDRLDGRPIKVRFTWKTNPGGRPTWEQAFSGDGGATWETNWAMEFQRRET